MIVVGGFRGRPLVALILLMVAWVGLRAVFWNTPAVSASSVPALAALPADDGPSRGARAPASSIAGRMPSGPQSVPVEGLYLFESGWAQGLAPWGPFSAGAMPGARQLRQASRPIGRLAGPRDYPVGPSRWGLFDPYSAQPYAPRQVSAEIPTRRPVPVRVAIAHQMLWMAAISRMPLPMDLFSRGGSAAPVPFYPSGGAAGSGKRWSADGWLLLRRGGEVSLASGVLPATYGASQLGGVLRYRLAPRSGHRPTAYLRTTAALNGSREKEAAVGLSVRPVRGWPVAVAAEMRATDRPGSREARPAVLAWTEIAPFELPFGARGEAYAQGGYVGGKFATAFVDGQLRVDRGVVRLGRTELRAGGGAWAGAQKGASRLDIGPTATVGVPLSNSASARVGVDWRFRVAGNAEPDSGPALTLSAGF